MRSLPWLLILSAAAGLLATPLPAFAQPDLTLNQLAGTEPLVMDEPLDVVMVRGINYFAERELARLRWTYLRLSLSFQLELAGAQIVLQRFGQQVEWLVSMLALCHHAAAAEDETQWRVADLQCALLRERVLAGKAGLRTGQLRRLRQRIAAVGGDVAAQRSSLLADIAPEPFAHPFHTSGPS